MQLVVSPGKGTHRRHMVTTRWTILENGTVQAYIQAICEVIRWISVTIYPKVAEEPENWLA